MNLNVMHDTHCGLIFFNPSNLAKFYLVNFCALSCAGYAGYVPAKMPPPMPTAIQEAMWQIQDIACLETITKLLRNTVVNPTEDKYRRIRLSNPKIKSLIMGRAGLQTLRALGWVQDAEDEDMLVLPKNAQLSMAEVRTYPRYAGKSAINVLTCMIHQALDILPPS